MQVECNSPLASVIGVVFNQWLCTGDLVAWHVFGADNFEVPVPPLGRKEGNAEQKLLRAQSELEGARSKALGFDTTRKASQDAALRVTEQPPRTWSCCAQPACGLCAECPSVFSGCVGEYLC